MHSAWVDALVKESLLRASAEDSPEGISQVLREPNELQLLVLIKYGKH